MTSVSRRGFVAGAMVVGVGAASVRTTAMAQPGAPVLLFDPDLKPGVRFATHALTLGGTAHRLEGDRVRQVQAFLANGPAAFFGITRHSDEWMIGEIAGQAGYRRVSLVQHRSDGAILPDCTPEGASIAALAGLAGGRWPEAFAELAIGGIERCEAVAHIGAAEPAFSWVLAKR